MFDKFAITDIQRIILVDRKEYTERITHFNSYFPYYELIYKLSGETILHFNGKTIKIHSGLVYLLPSGDNHEYWVERVERGDCIDIVFQSDNRITSELYTQATIPDGKIEQLFKKAFSVWVSQNEGYYFECASIIYEIFSQLQKQQYVSKDKLKKIKPALEYINTNFTNESISCNYLAERCGISYTYLKSIFLQQYKITPKEYINKMRINYACDLLKEGSNNVSQIALMSGFSDVYYFSRTFKKRIGISPTEFQKKYVSSK